MASNEQLHCLVQMDYTVSFLKGFPVCFTLALLEANAWISKSMLLGKSKVLVLNIRAERPEQAL